MQLKRWIAVCYRISARVHFGSGSSPFCWRWQLESLKPPLKFGKKMIAVRKIKPSLHETHVVSQGVGRTSPLYKSVFTDRFGVESVPRHDNGRKRRPRYHTDRIHPNKLYCSLLIDRAGSAVRALTNPQRHPNPGAYHYEVARRLLVSIALCAVVVFPAEIAA